MPRFVVLHHECPACYRRPTHWDFMLEWGDCLRTWALPEPPVAMVSMLAEPLADHRLEYLDYEGPVSGDRGYVSRWDFGDYEVEADEPSRLVLLLCGAKMHGRVTLESPPERPSAPPSAQRWLFAFRQR